MQLAILGEVHRAEGPLAEGPLDSVALERVRQRGRLSGRGPSGQGRVQGAGAAAATRLVRAGSRAADVLEGRGDRALVFGETLAILLGGGLLAALQAALQFDLQQLAEKGAALVARAGQVVAEVGPRAAAPGLLEARAGAVHALERVKRQRLG